MDEKQLLKKIGLTDYQTKAYLTLIRKGVMTAKELSEKSEVPQPKIYSVLEDLQEKNLIETLPDFPKKYKAVNPKMRVYHLIEEKKREINEIERESKKTLEQLEREYNKKRPEKDQYVWVIQRGKKEFLERVVEFINESNEEILFLTLHFSIYPGFKKALEKAVKRGVKVKVIGSEEDSTKEALKEYKKIGCKVRFYDHNYPRFAVFDNNKTAVRIGQFDINIVVENKGYSDIFESFFKEIWKKSKKTK